MADLHDQQAPGQQPQPGRRRRPGSPRPRQGRSAPGLRPLDLRELVDKGGAIRRHRFLSNVKSMLLPLLTGGVLQAILYAAIFLRADRWNPAHLATTLAVLTAGTVLIGLQLASLRRTRFPFTAAFTSAFVVLNFEIVVLAALRVQLSFWGLLAAAAVTMLAAIVANYRLNTGIGDRVAILPFANAGMVAQLIGGVPSIVDGPAEDISNYDIILFDGETHHDRRWSEMLTRAHMQGAELIPWFSYLEQRRGRVDIESFDISHLAYGPVQIYFARSKRFLDLVLVVLTLPLTIPLGCLIWLYIKLIDRGGTAIFAQTRRGYGGRKFRMYKFRTMYAGTHGGAAQPGDKRIMPGCRFLRRTRLDELPQVINIWRGQMSWVGPRPETIELAKSYEAEIPQYVYRLLTLPGITGWAQVNNGYTSNANEARIKLAYDLYYLKNISLDLEIEIFLRTVRTLVLRRGAR